MITKKQSLLLIALGVLLIVAVVITIYVSVSRRATINEQTKSIFTGVEDTATYTDVNGVELKLEDFLGQVLVVTSWATWSPFTATDLTSLDLLAAGYPVDQVTFMAINRKETKEQAARLLVTLPEFPRLKIIIDTQDHFYRSVVGYAMPETLVFDSTGEIVLHHRGELDPVLVRKAVDEAILSK